MIILALIPLLLFFSLLGPRHCSSTSYFEILAPTDNGEYFISPSLQFEDVEFLFAFDKQINNDGIIKFCVELHDRETSSLKVIAAECFDRVMETITVHQIPAGAYNFVAFFKSLDQPSASVKSVNFVVKLMKDSLPSLMVRCEDMALSYGDENGSTDITYTSEYFTINTLLSTCIEIKGSSDNLLVPPTCYNNTVGRLSWIPPATGEYLVVAYFRQRSHPFVIFPSSVTSTTFRVHHLTDVLPEIVFLPSSTPFEFSIPRTKNIPGTTDIKLNFRLTGIPTAIQQLLPCFLVSSVDRGNGAKDQRSDYQLFNTTHCVSSPTTGDSYDFDRTLILRQVPPGIFQIQGTFHVAGRPDVVLQTPVSIRVEVQLEKEFRPTYDWQPLHVWHTIPSGLITR